MYFIRISNKKSVLIPTIPTLQYMYHDITIYSIYNIIVDNILTSNNIIG